ncbi:hypothetical protein GCM10022404_16730 [Celeribacter arenosi]|uniref:Uncharacterized protein n=1 Tax=Celeribacter arenosi TaxID=792649 RepID=A0ABP7K8H9_9RHOB
MKLVIFEHFDAKERLLLPQFVILPLFALVRRADIARFRPVNAAQLAEGRTNLGAVLFQLSQATLIR